MSLLTVTNNDNPVTSVTQYTTADVASQQIAFSLGDFLLQSRLITHEQRLRVELAFQEALSNALEHGNLELESSWKDIIDDEGVDQFSRLKRERLIDPKYSLRKIYIKSIYKDGLLKISIRNEGKSFQVDAVMNQSLPDTQDQSYGRGVTLMKTVMDSLEYRDGGRELVMCKNLKIIKEE